MLSVRPLSTVMRSPLVVIAPEQTAASALAIAEREHVHHLPILQRGDLVGFVCTCDLRNASLQARVDEIMVPAVSLESSEPVHRAVALMRERRIGSCVVTVLGAPAGVVTRADLLAEMPQLAEVAEEWFCECCRSTEHLRTTPRGQALCVECLERAQEGGWFELGNEGA